MTVEALNNLVEIRNQWRRSRSSEQPALVAKAVELVHELVQEGQTFTPGAAELPRHIFDAFRPYCSLVPTGTEHTYPVFVKDYITKNRGQSCVNDQEEDLPAAWDELFKALLPEGYVTQLGQAGGVGQYDLALSGSYDLSRYSFSKDDAKCYGCDQNATTEYMYVSKRAGMQRGQSCGTHFAALQKMGVKVLAKRRKSNHNSSTWLSKDGMTLGDFTGDSKGAALTVVQAPKKKKDIAPFFKDNSGFIVWAKVPENVAKVLSSHMDEDITPHITLAYLDPASEVMSYDKNRTLEIVSGMVNRSEPLKARIGGFAKFQTHDGNRPLVALVDSKPLAEFRTVLARRLNNTQIPFHDDYSFTPHITLSKVDSNSNIPRLTAELEFDITDIEVVNATESRILNMGNTSDEIEPFVKATTSGEYGISDIDNEKRYTFTVVYKSNVADAHNEYITADELQEALWNHVRAGDRNVYIQHGRVPGVGFEKAGEWVELSHWPYDVDVDFQFVDGKIEKRTIPAGSIWMGTIWEPWAWEMIKSGTIRGLSFGGTSRRSLPEVE